MLSSGRTALIVIFILTCIGTVQVADAADVGQMNITLRANESLSCMAFNGDRMYVGGSYIVNYKAIGEVFIYDRAGALVNRFDITDPNPGDLHSMQPYGICMNDDGSVTVWTWFYLLTYGEDGALRKSVFVKDYLGESVNKKVYTISTGLATDGQHYYFGDSYSESVLKVSKDGALAGKYTGVNVTRSVIIQNGSLYVGDSGRDKIIVLDLDMNKKTEYPMPDGIMYMGTVDEYIIVSAGNRLYVYDRDMKLYNMVNMINSGEQVNGISQSGKNISVLVMNYRNRTQASLYVADTTLFTQLPAAIPPKSPDPAPVVGAIVAGGALGFLGIFLGKVQSILSGLYESLLERLPKAFKKFQDAVVGYVKGFFKSKIFKQESRLYKVEAKEHVPLILGFSSIEILVIAAGSVLLAASYALAKGAALGLENIVLFLVSGVVAMVAHDIAHRYLARKYNAVTEYQFWWLGSIIMFVTAIFFGVVYAVPARTIINNSDKLDKKVKGMVYLAGPLVSFAFAMFFLLLSFLGGAWTTLGLLGVSMNLLSSVYGLMPFNPMDGKKVVDWRAAVWAVAFIPVLIVYVLVTVYLA